MEARHSSWPLRKHRNQTRPRGVAFCENDFRTGGGLRHQLGQQALSFRKIDHPCRHLFSLPGEPVCHLMVADEGSSRPNCPTHPQPVAQPVGVLGGDDRARIFQPAAQDVEVPGRYVRDLGP